MCVANIDSERTNDEDGLHAQRAKVSTNEKGAGATAERVPLLSAVTQVALTHRHMPTNAELKAIMRSMEEAHHENDGSDTKQPTAFKVQRGLSADVSWQSFNEDTQLAAGDDGKSLKVWRTTVNKLTFKTDSSLTHKIATQNRTQNRPASAASRFSL